MPMIGGCLFDTPEEALLVSAPGPQKFAIAAAHQCEAALHETDGSIAQIVGFPSAIRDAFFAEENLGDRTISAPRRARIERADGGTQPLASLFGQFVKRRPWCASIHCAPQPSGSIRSCVEVTVERQLCYVASADSWRFFEPDAMLLCAQAKDRVPSIGGAPYLACRKI
ncbi:hypothetical protein UP10_13610 [Bradyrhizobium sp. LTSPM299]|nr:hypothetical protein UP10_13610 [Bradyrhizobium sp. LTSPM299]